MTLPGGREGDASGVFGEDGAILIEEELALPADERLPWLESGDEDEQPAIDTGRIVAFAGGAVLLLALVLGGTWWALSARSGQALVADGSTIEAPEEPYKTRPDDPGGIQVAGTGDTSFAVAEGRQVDARIDPGDAPPAPSIDLEQAGAAASVSASTPTLDGIGVQVGAYSTRAQAEAGWSTLVSRLEPLQGRGHRVIEGMADSGRVFRLQAVAGDVADADALCRAIKGAGGDCQVKR